MRFRNQNPVSIIAPLKNGGKVASVSSRIQDMQQNLKKEEHKEDLKYVHFFSASVIAIDIDHYYAVLEITVDGTVGEFLQTMLDSTFWRRIVDTIFQECEGFPSEQQDRDPGRAEFLKENPRIPEK